MKRYLSILPFIICVWLSGYSQGGDTLQFKGQLSAWFNYNKSYDEFLLGGRYIPEIYLRKNFNNRSSVDLDLSANIYGNLLGNPNPQGDIKPYRAWVRYSSSQVEFRVGLQKINFGSATMLRPLMWFDTVDPHDPLQLTDGVWGVLGRYYFLNNANIWLWGLYGNKMPKGMEFLATKEKTPEFGGRIQYPIPLGEAAFSYHHRVTSFISPPYDVVTYNIPTLPEDRFGLDAKIDWVVGFWVEASWNSYGKSIGLLTNQTLINSGVDYTFGVGNGLLAVYEHLIVSSDANPFEFKNKSQFSLISLSYPFGLFDNISTMFYYSWDMEKVYSFVNWQRTYNKVSLHLMAFWNPENIILPQKNFDSRMFGGKGVQLMFVFNH